MGAFSAKRDWGRLLAAMITPFDSGGEINYAEARRVARYLVDDQSNDGLVVCGTTGESPTLRTEEKLRLLEEILDEVGDRAAILMGAGTYDTRESCEVAREAESRGAHGIMLVNPYYSKPGQSGLYAHFKTIAGEVSLNVMLYNIQPRSAINLETDTLLRLAEIPNITAVKEASGNLGQIMDVCRLVPQGFRVYSGDDGLTVPILSVGGYGLVSVAAHVVGRELKEMITSFAQDPSISARIAHQLTPLVKGIFAYPSPVPIKYAVARRGFDTERVRLPLVELSDSEKEILDDIFGSLVQ